MRKQAAHWGSLMSKTLHVILSILYLLVRMHAMTIQTQNLMAQQLSMQIIVTLASTFPDYCAEVSSVFTGHNSPVAVSVPQLELCTSSQCSSRSSCKVCLCRHLIQFWP